jgi:hypothetical protein
MSVAGGAYHFPVDMEVPRELLENPYWQDRQIRYLTSRFSHVLIEAGRPVFGVRYGKNCAGEI